MRNTKRELAWFLVMLLLVTPSRAPHMGVMLLILVAFLWDGASARGRFALEIAHGRVTIRLQNRVQTVAFQPQLHRDNPF
jgi:hypothetical protein